MKLQKFRNSENETSENQKLRKCHSEIEPFSKCQAESQTFRTCHSESHSITHVPSRHRLCTPLNLQGTGHFFTRMGLWQETSPHPEYVLWSFLLVRHQVFPQWTGAFRRRKPRVCVSRFPMHPPLLYRALQTQRGEPGNGFQERAALEMCPDSCPDSFEGSTWLCRQLSISGFARACQRSLPNKSL